MEGEEDEVHFIATCRFTRDAVSDLIENLRNVYKNDHKPMPDTTMEITSAVLNGHMYLSHNDILNEGICEDDYAIRLEEDKWEEANRIANGIVYKLHHMREDEIAREADACISCHLQVRNEDLALSCDKCSRWQHIICGDIVSEEKYQFFLDSRAVISWVCRPCSKSTYPHST